MVFKKGIIYVTPDGIAMQGRVFETAKEQILNMWSALKDMVQQIASTIRGAFEKLTGHIEEINRQTKKEKMIRRSWVIPMNLKMNNQVMNRKPMFVHIRNHI